MVRKEAGMKAFQSWSVPVKESKLVGTYGNDSHVIWTRLPERDIGPVYFPRSILMHVGFVPSISMNDKGGKKRRSKGLGG